MIHQTITIDMDYERLGIQHKGTPATITTYIKDMYPDNQRAFNRPLVIICPGGGYEHHSPREGEAVALKLLSLGMNVLVLRYSLLPNEFPCALYEAAYTVDYARTHAKEWDINPDNIIIAGFSAGGHVAASLGTMWNQSELENFLEKELHKDADAVRPNGMLLGYPVITSGEYAHRLSFTRLLGDRYDSLLDAVSLEKRVSIDTPKTFLWHTGTDTSVPLENSLLFAQSLRRENVPFELHVFPEGNHGLGLGTLETDTKDGKHFQPEVAVWTELFARWAGCP
jgi:acetyl esterase/lipase